MRPSLNDLENNLSASDWSKRGYSYGKLKLLEESLRCYQRSLKLDSAFTGCHSNVGTALLRLGRLDEAHEQFLNEVQAHEENEIARAMLASSYEHMGDLVNAKRQFELATATNHPSGMVLREYYGFCRKHGFNSELINIVNSIEQYLLSDLNGIGISGWINEGLHFGLLGEFDVSLKFLDESAKIDAANVDAWYNLAVTQLYMLDIKGALFSTKTSLDINQNLIQSHFLMGILLCLADNVSDAILAWQRAVVLDETHRYGEISQRFIGLASGKGLLMVPNLISAIPPGFLYYRL